MQRSISRTFMFGYACVKHSHADSSLSQSTRITSTHPRKFKYVTANVAIIIPPVSTTQSRHTLPSARIRHCTIRHSAMRIASAIAMGGDGRRIRHSRNRTWYHQFFCTVSLMISSAGLHAGLSSIASTMPKSVSNCFIKISLSRALNSSKFARRVICLPMREKSGFWFIMLLSIVGLISARLTCGPREGVSTCQCSSTTQPIVRIPACSNV